MPATPETEVKNGKNQPPYDPEADQAWELDVGMWCLAVFDDHPHSATTPDRVYDQAEPPPARLT
jgi:hypothetical protein